MATLKIGIRKGRVLQLAGEEAAAQLQSQHEDLAVKLVPIDTSVRYTRDDPEAYILELEEALRDREVDLVLHLLKEIPVRLPEEVQLLAISERITPFDAFVSHEYILLDELPDGARVGVSHVRQKAQLLIYRFDLEPVEIHGSVDSRLQQLESRELAGLLISAESLERLGLQDQVTEIVTSEIMLPTPGQGCLGWLGRGGDERATEILAPISDQTSRLESVAERAFLDRLGGNPEIALGARAALDSKSMIIEGVLATADGSTYIRDAIQGPPDKAEILGIKLAELLLALGHEELHGLVLGRA